MGQVLELRDNIAGHIEKAIAPMGITTFYRDSESLRAMKSFERDIVIMHRMDTDYEDTDGVGFAKYITQYYIVWITPKDIAGRNTTATMNEEKLDEFTTAIRNQLESSVTGGSDILSGVPRLMSYSYGNELDPIGLPGTDEKKWKDKLVIWMLYAFPHRLKFNC